MPPEANAPQGRTPGLLDRSAAAWLALGVSCALTIALAQYVATHLDTRAQDRFMIGTEVARNQLLSRMRAYEQVLRGGAALFAASEHVDRKEWHDYVAALDLDDGLPGIQGIGFAELIPASRLDEHHAAVRSEGFPGYSVHPPGARDPYTSIVYLEPFIDRNLRAFGYDMSSEPVRREAMSRARDSGQAALSGKVTLVQEDGRNTQPGFLIYLPVFDRQNDTRDVVGRRTALLGYVYSPFRAHDMMRSIFADGLRNAIVELFDDHPDDANLLFASAPARHDARHTVTHAVEVGGRNWVVRFSSTAAFEADSQSAEPMLILVGGSALGVLVFTVLRTNALHRRRMQAAANSLAASRDEFRALVENVPGVVFRCQVGAPWPVIHIGQSVEALTGATADEFVSGAVSFADFIEPEDIPRIEQAIRDAADKQTSYEVEYRMLGRDGAVRWVSERGRVHADALGRDLWLDGVIVDISALKHAEETMRSLAFVDTLTQLPNRRFLLDRLRQVLANSRRHGHHGALLFVDLDHFKAVNDAHGHEAGDELLCEVASRLRQCVREGDTVARLGGDEFVIMLEDLGDSSTEAFAKGTVITDKILAALNQPFEVGSATLQSTPSIGLTCFSGEDDSAESLLRRADAAMYRAKAGGRNRVETSAASALALPGGQGSARS